MPEIFSTDLELIRVEIFWVSLVGIWLLYSLFATWIATRTWHWFVRFVLISMAAFVLQAIEASDLMLMQLFNCLTVFLLFASWKLFRDWRSNRTDGTSWSFGLSLANLFLVVGRLQFCLQ